MSNIWWALIKTRVSKPTLNPTQPPVKRLKTNTKVKAQSVAMDCAFRNLKMGDKMEKK
jgi:hypothetical protein